MSMRYRASSGTYNVRATEMARDKSVKTVRCIVHFLDDTETAFDIDKRAKAQFLLEKVFEHLELIEKDYFGLQYADLVPAPDAMFQEEVEKMNSMQPSHSDLMRWLDPLKTLKKQIRAAPPYVFHFRVKFYVSDPSKLQEEYTRYHFFLQLKKDISEGRLVVPYKTAVLLASLSVQSELGDYNPEEHKESYLSEFRFIPGQTQSFEQEVAAQHRTHKGATPADAELTYLETAKRLDMYGVDLHSARDQSNLDIQLGVTSAGLVVFQNNVRQNTFSWAKIVKISFKRKQFFIQLRRELAKTLLSNQGNQNDNVDNLIGFNMVSYRSCKNLWKSCVEHHTFFRLHAPKPAPRKGFFPWRPTFRYSGKTEFQTIEDNKKKAAKVDKVFVRSPSKKYARRTIGAHTRNAIEMEEKHLQDGYHANSHTGLRNGALVNHALHSNHVSHTTGTGTNTTPVHTITRSTGATTNTTNHNANSLSLRTSPGRTLPGRPPPSSLLSNSTSYPNSLTSRHNAYNAFNHNSLARATLPPDYKHTADLNRNSKSWSEGKLSDDDGGFLSRSQTGDSLTAPAVPPKMLTSGSFPGDDDNSISEQTYELPLYNEPAYLPNGNAYGDGHGLVTIRMRPDSQGRFGFNVKGGADQGMPIIVSRVAPNTPADVCIPRLNEGDQVLYINGRDVSQHTHEQVVMFIRASRETHSGELVLVVRPNVYIGEDSTDPEPDFVYNPDTQGLSTPLPPGSDPLSGSIALLCDALESGAALAQFDQMYRKKPGMTHKAAGETKNATRNRYRDIWPYDQTRVLLQGNSGDYINANYVNMEIPGSGIVNRYIAAQGPLPNTCADFWQMIWEQQCRLVVMLTTKVERGRVKCHQYWPNLYETVDYGKLQVTCLKEQTSQSFAFREFTLVNIEDARREERHIRQMQYLAWPDHGVPDDSSDFLSFVMQVRSNRAGMVEPTVVHCSAGIGRTGVLITMETSMCLMEANQAVFPLDILRQMRDQRAMLIQTSSQYKFVCEAISRVYKEKIVKPLDDFKR